MPVKERLTMAPNPDGSKPTYTFETVRTMFMRMGNPAFTYLTCDEILEAMCEVRQGEYEGLNELMVELLKDYLEERREKAIREKGKLAPIKQRALVAPGRMENWTRQNIRTELKRQKRLKAMGKLAG